MSSDFLTTQLEASIRHSIQSTLTGSILPDISFFWSASPVLLLLLGGMLTMLLGVFKGNPLKPCISAWYVAIASAFLATLFPILGPTSLVTAYFGSGFLLDTMSKFSFLVISLGTLFTLFAVNTTSVGRNLLRAELLSLLLFASAGLMVMCSAGDFIAFLVGLEVVSVPLYVLVGFQRKTTRSVEASLKYFLMGATAAAVMLMGAALVYASIGSLRFSDFHLLSLSLNHPFHMLGIFLILSGLAFKAAIVPFHTWAPDVYQSANSHLTGYMASLVKFSVVIVLIRLLSVTFAHNSNSILVQYFWILGALSIAVGSLFGMVNSSIKRMLAYSSIANAGYFCLGFASLATSPDSDLAKQALISYATIYAVLSMGAFTVIAWFEESNQEDILKHQLAGIGPKKPFAAFALSVFLFGFAGLPPMAGFFGKFFLIVTAIRHGLVGLSVVLVLFSVASLYYYLSVMSEIWFKPHTQHSILPSENPETDLTMRTLCLTAVIVAFAIGILGPRFAFEMDFKQATEKAYHQPKSSFILGSLVNKE